MWYSGFVKEKRRRKEGRRDITNKCFFIF